MIFEASKTIGPGRSITARLDAGANRIRMETAGHVAHQEQAAALPALLQHLADASRLPVRWGGTIYHPRRRVDPDACQTWGAA